MSFETIFKEKIELEKLVVALTRENMELKQRYNCGSGADQLFADWILDWLKKSQIKIKNNTYAAYEIQVTKHIEPYFRNRKVLIGQITPKLLEEYYTDKLREGLSGRTIRKHASNICAALDDAVKNKIIAVNPCMVADKPSIERFSGNMLDEAQLYEVFSQTRNSRIHIPVVIAAFLGLRRSEVLGLRWSAIDFEHKVIHISHTVVKVKKGLQFSDLPKTKSSRRTLPCPEQLLYFLQKVKKSQVISYIKNQKTYCRRYLQYVCVDELGDLIKPDTLTNDFAKIINKLGYKCRLHDLRHTCASLLIRQGIPMKQVSVWLGHSSTAITSDIYVHLSFQDKIETADVLNHSIRIPDYEKKI